jgi:hypothetical protein
LAANLILSSALALSPDLPVSYEMRIRLDTDAHKLIGHEKIAFVNPTLDTLTQVCFHLYPNAFRETSTIFALESARMRGQIQSGDRSDLTIYGLEIDGIPIGPDFRKEAGTLLYVTLPGKLPPGDSVTMAMDFELLVPRKQMRFGFDEHGNYLLAHWHPILCGYQNGRLIDFEYHELSEFFSNFSNYDVTIEIPPDFEIGSTGDLEMIEKDSVRAVWRASADSVIDFAFACGPGFEVFETDTLGIKIRYLLEKSHSRLFGAVDQVTKFSLAYCSDALFPYPYSKFTVVDFQFGAGGMELPGMNIIEVPGGPRAIAGPMLRFTIAHEVAHEWFYAAVATNEAEEPFLDEGLATYMTGRIMGAVGNSLNNFSIFGYRLPFDFFDDLIGLSSRAEWPLSLTSWQYPDQITYSAIVYFRGALALETLECMVGRVAFDSALAAYARQYRFRHPDTGDLRRSLERSLGIDLGNFWRQFVTGTSRMDYAVRELNYHSLPDTAAGKTIEISLTVGRELDGILPQPIRIGLADGSAIDTLWDGAEKTRIFEFRAGSRPEYARLGPEDAYPLDEDRANNTLYLKSFGLRLLTFEWDAIFALEFLLTLFL